MEPNTEAQSHVEDLPAEEERGRAGMPGAAKISLAAAALIAAALAAGIAAAALAGTRGPEAPEGNTAPIDAPSTVEADDEDANGAEAAEAAEATQAQAAIASQKAAAAAEARAKAEAKAADAVQTWWTAEETPAKTETVHHPAETETVTEMHTVCNTCKANIDDDPQGHIDQTGHAGFTRNVPVSYIRYKTQAHDETVEVEPAKHYAIQWRGTGDDKIEVSRTEYGSAAEARAAADAANKAASK